MGKQDYYDILGVSRDASEEVLKRSYRNLAFKYHPDRNPNDPIAREKFMEVTEAYYVLNDTKKRGLYDHYGQNESQSSSSRDSGHAEENVPNDQSVLEFGWDELAAIQDAISKLVESTSRFNDAYYDIIDNMVIVRPKTKSNLLNLGDSIKDILGTIADLNEVVEHILNAKRKV